ncbi:MAG: DUF4190 domain-containing protein [Clostridiaceae bacterium]
MRTEGFSIAALVLGIVGLVLIWMPVIGFVCALLGLIFGIVGRNKINASEEPLSGKGMATAGLIMGIIVLVLSVLGFVACGALFSGLEDTSFLRLM